MTTSASSATMKKATDVRSRLIAGRVRLLVSITDAFLVRCVSSHRPYGASRLVSTSAGKIFIPNAVGSPPGTSFVPGGHGSPAVEFALERGVTHGPLGPLPGCGRLGG